MGSFALLARALLAYSVHEHQEGHARRIDVWLRPRSFTVQDDGRGMGLHREGYVADLMGLLCGARGALQLHGVGLSVIAASTPSLVVESRRGGKRWTQTFAWGIAGAPPSSEPSGPETGTCITMTVAPGSPDIDPAQVLAQVDVWRDLHKGLTIAVH
jgi:DNA gyrase/topoisomerase IV subunit B